MAGEKSAPNIGANIPDIPSNIGQLIDIGPMMTGPIARNYGVASENLSENDGGHPSPISATIVVQLLLGTGGKNVTAEGDGYFRVYEEHMKTLRAWFVAYGVGGPILFVTQKDFAEVLIASGELRQIAYLFFGGVALQVCLAALNKWVNWHLYYTSDLPEEKRGAVYCVTSWISSKFGIDVFCDVGTAALFAWATINVLVLFATGETG